MPNTATNQVPTPAFVKKLKLEVIEDTFGKLTINIDWDEQDPELAEWIGWGDAKQTQFIVDLLTERCMKKIQQLTQPTEECQAND